MNRAEFRSAYREARKFYRFQITFWDKLCKLPELTFQVGCPGFTASRLSGDVLAHGHNAYSRPYLLSGARLRLLSLHGPRGVLPA